MDEVLEICRLYPAAQAILGGRATMTDDFTHIRMEKHPVTGAAYKRGISRVKVNVNRFKTKLHQHITTGIREGAPRAFHVHRGTSDEYFRQMASEHLVREPYGREQVMLSYWKPKPGVAANHLWDAETYAIAAAASIYVYMMKEPKPVPDDEEAEVRPEEVEWQD